MTDKKEKKTKKDRKSYDDMAYTDNKTKGVKPPKGYKVKVVEPSEDILEMMKNTPLG